jgi:hypothetical protein
MPQSPSFDARRRSHPSTQQTPLDIGMTFLQDRQDLIEHAVQCP